MFIKEKKLPGKFVLLTAANDDLVANDLLYEKFALQ